ncbi:enoyl-CoA hydratase/isomerase family protein [Roseovarius sp. SYSU LYC5161]|uniref:enoyl-CoA hydratase/isomerase family protein n=1 Tax=Roseovarius halophilus (ex Wu et al. 2025) TaxID=3376060 RepID=UPI002870E387|nr:enoyl-CoA hydratase/isomerase family protein [Roseovarius sp.]
MTDIDIRTEGRAGRITLSRPAALNALTHEMCHALENALDAWQADPDIDLVIIDAAGDKAFCAGGDIQRLYDTGRAGDFDVARRFWRDEYRLNAKIAEYPKPYIAFMQGFTMGGGVGIGCHGTHRVVCGSSRIAMPECGIGLVPDVGGSLLLARAPGRMGEYIATTGARMGPADAIECGFADTFIPAGDWPDTISQLCSTGDSGIVADKSQTPPAGALIAQTSRVNAHFGGETLGDILNSLRAEDSDFADDTLRKLSGNSPLSMACAIEMIHRLRGSDTDIRHALELEYRFTHRAMEHGDFLEGIRAAVIDKDRSPKWLHDLENPPSQAVTQMLMPLGAEQLSFDNQGRA